MWSGHYFLSSVLRYFSHRLSLIKSLACQDWFTCHSAPGQRLKSSRIPRFIRSAYFRQAFVSVLCVSGVSATITPCGPGSKQ